MSAERYYIQIQPPASAMKGRLLYPPLVVAGPGDVTEYFVKVNLFKTQLQGGTSDWAEVKDWQPGGYQYGSVGKQMKQVNTTRELPADLKEKKFAIFDNIIIKETGDFFLNIEITYISNNGTLHLATVLYSRQIKVEDVPVPPGMASKCPPPNVERGPWMLRLTGESLLLGAEERRFLDCYQPTT